MLTLQFEDTPANRAMLRQLGAHASDDEASFFEDAEMCEDADLPRGVDHTEMAEAYTEFNDAVVSALEV